MAKINISLLLLICSMFDVACADSFSKSDDVSIIDFSQTKKLLKQGAVFIDNRPEHKFADGHIKGAVNLPYFQKNDLSNKMTKDKLLEAIGNKKVVVFYCSGQQRAYHALKQAEEWGINADMHWYKNGFEEWKDKGLTIK